jgi:hypothetical protein
MSELNLAERTWLRIPIQGGFVQWEGAVSRAAFVRADGHLEPDPRPGTVAGPGTLTLLSRPGWTFVWQEKTPGAGPPWGSVELPEGQTVDMPAVLKLQGRGLKLILQPDDAGLILLRSPEPLVVDAPGLGVMVFGTDTHLDLPTDGSVVELRVRSPGFQALAGELEISHVAAESLEEGLGPVTLLKPGGSRVFRFRVPRSGPVGVGVRADSGDVEMSLRDDESRLLGTGVLQMHQLAAGTYYLTLSLPSDAQPVRARAAIAGLEPPGLGPPEEIVARYLELEGKRSGDAGEGMVP